VVWFRRDLRVDDNHALHRCVLSGAVVPVFVWSPEEEGQFYPGRASRWWLKKSLKHLSASLQTLGAPLIVRRSRSTLAVLLEVIAITGATQLFYNHLYGESQLPPPGREGGSFERRHLLGRVTEAPPPSERGHPGALLSLLPHPHSVPCLSLASLALSCGPQTLCRW